MPCGSVAYWDSDCGTGYRCQSCFAIIGSIGQPRSCKEEQEKYVTLKALGGGSWDYLTGTVNFSNTVNEKGV